MSTQRVIIVGGGVVGVSCAYELARRGVSVVLFERGRIAGECSFGNSGFVAPGHGPICEPELFPRAMATMVDPMGPLYVAPPRSEAMLDWLLRFRNACEEEHCAMCARVLGALGQSMLERFGRLIEEERIECDWRPGGSAYACFSEQTMEGVRRKQATYVSQGFEAELLNGETLLGREPALRSDAIGGLALGQGASLHPYRFTMGMARAAAKRGVEMHEDVTVESIETRDGRATGVTLGEGRRVEAEAVVVCAGVATPRFVEPFGITLPVQAVKGYHVDVRATGALLNRVLTIPDADVLLTPMDDFVRISGTMELNEDDSLTDRRREAMRKRAVAYMPALDSGEVISRWMGRRPAAPDGLPVIGPAPGVDGLFVATAHARLGLSLAPITGSMIADLVMDGESGDWVGELGVGRF